MYFGITANNEREAVMLLLHDSVFYWQVEITFLCVFVCLYLLGTLMCYVIKCTVILAWIPSKKKDLSPKRLFS